MRQQIQGKSRRVRYPAASIPFQVGDPDQCAILISGLARVFISADSGRQATIRYVHAGELMGAAIVGDEPLPASVQMVTEAVALHLDVDFVRALSKTEHEVALALAKDLAARYQHSIRSATVLIFGSTSQKIAYDLLERGCREQLATGTLTVKATQQDLADSINSSREVVSRAIAELRRRAILSSGMRATMILDPARLESVIWRGFKAA